MAREEHLQQYDTISPQPWSAPWNDDNAILAMIRKLNFGDSTNERNEHNG